MCKELEDYVKERERNGFKIVVKDNWGYKEETNEQIK